MERAKVSRRRESAPARSRASKPGSMHPVWRDLLALQRLAGNAAVAAALAPERDQLSGVHRATRDAGVPVDQHIRALMESRLGQDLSSVRVHTGSAAAASARALSARAYTVGDHIVLAGRYDPADRSVQRTLAHELTHVVQQRSGPVEGVETGGGVRVSDPGDRFERAAERVASEVMTGSGESVAGWSREPAAARIAGVPAVQRDKDDDDRTVENTVSPPAGTRAKKVTATQYRITGRERPRLIEQVERRIGDDGDVYYVAIGKVVGYANKIPVIGMYREEIDLGDWRPRVTHLNGMDVTPKAGIESAEDLKERIDDELDGAEEYRLDEVDLLYTYSAIKRLNQAGDLVDCIGGKFRAGGKSTQKQIQIMLDAVHEKRRVTVSAHSRGTIKTDNAVRAVHKKLTAEYAANPPDPASTLSPARQAKDEMDKYIQLIYAGNAVQYPSRFLKIEMTAKRRDLVSAFVGSYTGWGARGLGGAHKGTTMKGGRGGHGFTANYADDVAGFTARDIERDAAVQ